MGSIPVFVGSKLRLFNGRKDLDYPRACDRSGDSSFISTEKDLRRM